MSKHSSYSNEGTIRSLGRKVEQIAERLVGPPSNDRSHAPTELLGAAIHARRLRFRFFPNRLFGEPAWDILLELLHAQAENREVTLTRLCEAAAVEGTVARRWVGVLESEGLIRRQPNPKDPTSELIQLEPKADTAFRQFFDELGKIP